MIEEEDSAKLLDSNNVVETPSDPEVKIDDVDAASRRKSDKSKVSAEDKGQAEPTEESEAN